MRHSYLRPLGIGSNNDDAMRIGDKPGSDVPGDKAVDIHVINQ
ncbi:MAG: hypothetical protein RXP99_01910 [Vulcanisaeta sp.]